MDLNSFLETSPHYYIGYIKSGLNSALEAKKYGKEPMPEWAEQQVQRSFEAVQKLEALMLKGHFELYKDEVLL